MFVDTWDQACCIQLSEDRQMVMPGDTCESNILLKKPMVLSPQTRFLVRENQITALTGVVTKLLPKTDIKIKGFNFEPPRPSRIEGNVRSVLRKRSKNKEKAQP